LGDFKDVLPQADLVVLLGKKLDYVIQFGTGAALNPNCKFAQIDAEAEAIEHTQKAFDGNSRLVAAVQADPTQAALLLADTLSAQAKSSGWLEEMTTAIAHRPSEWDDIVTPDDMPLHAVDICRAVQAYLDGNPDAIYVSDGGEFGQWAQAYLRAPRRVINGPAGSIGTSVPYAMGAREACPNARIVTMLGDGTFGFHAAEFDTAFRHNIPFIAVVGNDAAWNAEYQIQLHTYGKDRLIGCELLPARYDELAKSLGGYGEYVTSASQMSAAIERAHESGLPACINVSLQRNAAPVAHSGG
jgi:acetolactate synthase-1/2/3 large subunit